MIPESQSHVVALPKVSGRPTHGRFDTAGPASGFQVFTSIHSSHTLLVLALHVHWLRDLRFFCYPLNCVWSCCGPPDHLP